MTTHHKKALGVWILSALVIGNMVGSGVFLLPASLAHYGSISVFAWIITSIGATCIALVFATLSRVMPKIGGPYAYARDGMGNFWGFQTAYNYWIYIWVGNAAIVISFVGYLSYFFPVLNHNHLASFLVAVITIWTLTALNIKGVKEAGIFQLFTVILKTIPLILIILIGLMHIHPAYFHPLNATSHSTFSALLGSATLTLWALTGVESATIPADDVKDPEKNIPRATMIGTIISAFIYILGTIAVMGLIPMQELAQSSAPFAQAAQAVLGTTGATIIALAAIISTLGAINGWILLQGQVPFAASQDRLFPRVFNKRNKAGTPANGLILSSVLITLLLGMNYQASLVTQFTLIILLATMAVLIVYLFSAISEIVLMRKMPEKFNKKNLLKNTLICLIAIIYIIFAMIGSGGQIISYGCVLFLSGIPIYYLMKKNKNKA